MKKSLIALFALLLVLTVTVLAAQETIAPGETQPLFLRLEFGTKTKAGDAGLTDNEYLKSITTYDAENILVDADIITALSSAATTPARSAAALITSAACAGRITVLLPAVITPAQSAVQIFMLAACADVIAVLSPAVIT